MSVLSACLDDDWPGRASGEGSIGIRVVQNGYPQFLVVQP